MYLFRNKPEAVYQYIAIASYLVHTYLAVIALIFKVGPWEKFRGSTKEVYTWETDFNPMYLLTLKVKTYYRNTEYWLLHHLQTLTQYNSVKKNRTNGRKRSYSSNHSRQSRHRSRSRSRSKSWNSKASTKTTREGRQGFFHLFHFDWKIFKISSDFEFELPKLPNLPKLEQLKDRFARASSHASLSSLRRSMTDSNKDKGSEVGSLLIPQTRFMSNQSLRKPRPRLNSEITIEGPGPVRIRTSTLKWNEAMLFGSTATLRSHFELNFWELNEDFDRNLAISRRSRLPDVFLPKSSSQTADEQIHKYVFDECKGCISLWEGTSQSFRCMLPRSRDDRTDLQDSNSSSSLRESSDDSTGWEDEVKMNAQNDRLEFSFNKLISWSSLDDFIDARINSSPSSQSDDKDGSESPSVLLSTTSQPPVLRDQTNNQPHSPLQKRSRSRSRSSSGSKRPALLNYIGDEISTRGSPLGWSKLRDLVDNLTTELDADQERGALHMDMSELKLSRCLLKLGKNGLIYEFDTSSKHPDIKQILQLEDEFERMRKQLKLRRSRKMKKMEAETETEAESAMSSSTKTANEADKSAYSVVEVIGRFLECKSGFKPFYFFASYGKYKLKLNQSQKKSLLWLMNKLNATNEQTLTVFRMNNFFQAQLRNR